ncbi:hypothetical protein A2U01_0070019, partial [Trifolium medium]|nr:hypothetical protein [Trifolium medium]
GRIHGKQDFLSELEAELPVQAGAGVELSAVARHASFPYDASRPAPAVLDIADASLVVAATTESTDLLPIQPP